ncbi:MAG: FemAB family XrtA/PEP-CTERM system-associated protein [Pseudomonadota bacterium]
MSVSDAPTDIAVQELAAQDVADWDRWVDAHDNATFYHLAGWRDVISQCFGRKSHYLVAKRAEHIVGVLPLVRLKSLLFGDFLVSMPYLSYGGVVAEDASVRDALLLRCAELAQRLGVKHSELRHVEDWIDWPKRTEKVTMQLPLLGDSEARWKALGAKRRSQIKRPLREGVDADVGGIELVDDFYRVLSRKYRDLGTPVYPKAWFRAIAERFPDNTKIFVVRMKGETVAASMVVSYRGSLEVPYAASLREVDRLGVNMFLYWTMVKYAEDNDYRVFDFGRSTVDSGTYKFKKQWGAEPVPLYWHYWLRDGGDVPVLNTSNPKYELLINTWRRLPVWVTTLVGPRIVRNLP